MNPIQITATCNQGLLEIVFRAPGLDQPGHAFFAALNTEIAEGSAVLPFGKDTQGSTVFLPFRANRLYAATVGPAATAARGGWLWRQTAWIKAREGGTDFQIGIQRGEVRLSIPLASLGPAQSIAFTAYAKDLRENEGWGRMLACPEWRAKEGLNDQSIDCFRSVNPAIGQIAVFTRTGPERMRIYQLLPRLFGNSNETRKPNGTAAENGAGKFADLNDAALSALREMSFTHLWLTGVLQQATATDYASIGEPADDADLLKGLAGSPYAIKDYFDVSPDYAEKTAARLAEFKELLSRMRRHGLRAIIDFVPNHVARSYRSNIRPGLTFGGHDDPQKFFDPRNNFFYLRPEDDGKGPPLILPTLRDGQPISPTCQVLGTCDGRYDGETEIGRVTGNNVVSWRPSLGDWYETVKLNYGYDFTTGAREYPHGESFDKPLPDTWLKMDAILAYWQEIGVDGFRCDMAHMVPPEFWAWAIGRARARHAEVCFLAEAYNNDPAKVGSGSPLLQALDYGRGNVMFDLLSAGFDAVYDDPSYKQLKAIYDGSCWANDLDGAFPHEYIFHNALRYAENHDEVRLANRHWGALGPAVGRPVSAILFGLGRGPLLIYHGQEVGEPAHGTEGFGGDDARTTIFDYWSMPEFTKWVNEHRYDGERLSPEQRELRAFYARLVRLAGETAFRDGNFFPLNAVNNQNERFGRLAGEPASGHWLYAFLRSTGLGGAHFLIVVNLHPTETFREVQIRLSPEALAALTGGKSDIAGQWQFREQLSTLGTLVVPAPDADGVSVPAIPPLTPFYFEATPLAQEAG